MPLEMIESKIYLIRGKKVMLDHDLAGLYKVEPKQLKRQVRRNLRRFPPDFMFQLNSEEHEILRCQNGTLRHGQFVKYLPYAFSEHGTLMLSSILNSERAIEVNIKIMRIFNKIREFAVSYKAIAERLSELEKKHSKHELEITTVFKVLKKLIEKPVIEEKPKRRIGFLSE
jgi:hypothetical protein